MISCIFGLCGSGKSLLLGFLTDRALNDKNVNYHGLMVSSNRHYDRVYTNFNFHGCYKLDFNTLGYSDYSNCLMIIDEIMLLADCRNFKSYGDNLKLFFSQHRKKHIDIIYATQSYDDVDKKIRNVTDNLYYIDDSILPSYMRIRRIVHSFDVYSCKTSYAYSAPVDNLYLKRKKLYRLVDSYELVVSDKEKYFVNDVPEILW